MALMEINKCSDIKCKYLCVGLICPEDDFDEEMYGECNHPLSPKNNSLGTDDNEDYLDIPKWCPLRRD